MTIDRRSLIATTGAAAAGSLLSTRTAAAQGAVNGSKSAALFLDEDDGLAPATFDRLPLEWHQMSRLPWSDHKKLRGLRG